MKLFCWIFILSVAIVSPIFLDLYPFSVFPMFSDNASQYAVIEISDANGNELRAADYGLHKRVLANRSQRYGRTLGPCYFDDHQTIQVEQVNAFLATHFPDHEYPITVRHWTRGFDKSTKTIQDLTSPQQFSVDKLSLAGTQSEQQNSELTEIQPSGHESKFDVSGGQASNQIGAIR